MSFTLHANLLTELHKTFTIGQVLQITQGQYRKLHERDSLAVELTIPSRLWITDVWRHLVPNTETVRILSSILNAAVPMSVY